MSTTIYSIGHGRHPFEYFLRLLKKYKIEFVCDVRAFARSRWPHFNGHVLAELLADHGIGYEHLPETGGKNNPDPADVEWGVNRLIETASEMRTAMMCSESKPLTDHKQPRANCHRVGKLAPLLRAKGVDRIIHILPDGETAEFDEAAFPSIW
ncbi:MAG: DUF488 domain-containing protein [Pyrinomonadaceae bacterium]|nr:DUF488 domain-containing protein [Pyrinomonadaceae bacterium]